MSASETSSLFTAFVGDRRLARGDLATVARAVHGLGVGVSSIVLSDESGDAVDLDLRGTSEEAVARLGPTETAKPTRGRPRLGVAAREVTLLPRHWNWLAQQPGGASAALRRLVDTARGEATEVDALRAARDAAYRAMTTLAGDRPGYEETVRALFAGNGARAIDLARAWPSDIAAYIEAMILRATPRG